MLVPMLGTAALAADERSRGDRLLPENGGTSWSAFVGYGFAQDWRRGQDIDIRSAGVRWSNIGRRRGSGALLGHHSLGLELLPWISLDQEPGATGASLSVLYEYHFAPRGRWLPVTRVGAGYLRSDREVPPGEVRGNFSLFAAGALRLAMSQRSALEFEYRIHHVSNAGRGPENPGINAITLLVGVAYY